MNTRPETALGGYEAHPVWHHWLRRNAVMEVRSFNTKIWPAPMVWRTNAQACRYSRNLSARPPHGARRIIVLGDSFTEGYYQDTTMSAVLEHRLNALRGPLLYEVVNCGTSSYSPLLYYLRYKHHLAKYHPDELIVNIDLSDVFDDNDRYGPNVRFAPDGEPLEAKPTVRGMAGIVDNLRYKFQVARLIFGTPGPNFKTVLVDSIYVYHTRLTPDSARWQNSVKVSLGYLQRLVDLTRSQHVQLIFTMYPYQEQFRAPKGGQLWHRDFEFAVKAFAQRNGVPFYSAYDALLPFYQRGTVPLYWNDDVHFTPVGQFLWGNVFADWYLQQRNLVGTH